MFFGSVGFDIWAISGPKTAKFVPVDANLPPLQPKMSGPTRQGLLKFLQTFAPAPA